MKSIFCICFLLLAAVLPAFSEEAQQGGDTVAVSTEPVQSQGTPGADNPVAASTAVIHAEEAPAAAATVTESSATVHYIASDVFQPFFIFTESGSKLNNFSPAGWMGDSGDLKCSGSYQVSPQTGNTCYKVTYTARGKKGWAGIYWQHPANNWGNEKGGYDLRGARRVTFWARGEKGGEIISEFKAGGIAGKFPDSDTSWTGPVKLSREWRMYFINLSGKDLRYINGGFCFTVLRIDNPNGCTFYLDEIRYE